MILKNISGNLEEVGISLFAGGGGQLPHLTIASDPGSTVTATFESSTVTAEETSSGIFELDLPTWDTYTITSVLDEETVQGSFTPNSNFHYALYHFTATVEVTFPGNSCQLTKSDQETQIATESPYTFTVHEQGEYQITVTHRGVIRTEFVTFTTNGQEESVSFIPVGETVTPINDISTWLECGSLWDKNYTTLSEVIADSETLLALISNENAADYMARSYKWAGSKGLIPVMTSNSAPSGTASASSVFSSDYDAYKAFDGNPNTRWSINTNQGYTTGWLRYDFPSVTIVRTVMIDAFCSSGGAAFKHAYFQVSDDGSNWTNAQELAGVNFTSGHHIQKFTIENPSPHKYYRLNFDQAGYNGVITLWSVQFFSETDVEVESIVDDPLSMLYIGQYNYCANKLLDRNRNLNSYPYYQTTKTVSGITYTVNVDGSVSISGTATANSNITLHTRLNDESFKVPNGSYRIFGCPKGGGDGKYRYSIGKMDKTGQTQTAIAHDYGEGDSFTVDGDMYDDGYTRLNVEIIVYSGQSFSTPITFYPMLCKIDDTDNNWEPYLPWLKPICESEYFELVLNSKVPLMTNNTTPSGTAFCTEMTDVYMTWAYKAFDRDSSTEGTFFNNSSCVGAYLGYQFTSEKKIYLIKGDANLSTGVTHTTSFKFQYSSDGIGWVDVPNSVVTVTNVNETPQTFTDIVCDVEGEYIRIICTASTKTDARGFCRELQFYGRNNVTPPTSHDLKTFATASNEEILEMVCKADRGEIDLYDDAGWRVGQEHSVSIDPIAASGSYNGASWSVGETQSAQSATFVLMHKGLYKFSNSVSVLDKQGQARDTCSFVAGMKDCLGTKGYINSTNTNDGSWEACARRAWCNYGFRQALPMAFRASFKLCKVVTALTYNGSSNKTSDDYFALMAEKEVFGSRTYSNSTEASALTQLTYYETASNRIKKIGSSGNPWWERSIGSSAATTFCNLATDGTARVDYASSTYGISPFGCL